MDVTVNKPEHSHYLLNNKITVPDAEEWESFLVSPVCSMKDRTFFARPWVMRQTQSRPALRVAGCSHWRVAGTVCAHPLGHFTQSKYSIQFCCTRYPFCRMILGGRSFGGCIESCLCQLTLSKLLISFSLTCFICNVEKKPLLQRSL